VPDALELIKGVKAINAKFITVMGGPHSTSLPEATLEACQDLDFVVIGEGEITLFELCECLEGKGDICKIQGLAYRYDDIVRRTSLRPLVENIDSLPFPERDNSFLYKKKFKTYDHSLNFPLEKITEVITSRGCTDFCTFCTVHRAYTEKGRSLRLRSPENVVAEIESIKEKYKIKHVSFLDDSFTVDHQRIRKIFTGLKRMNLSWNCDTRINLVDRDLIHEMVESGCKKISIGVESGSDTILKLINKNITIKEAQEVFRWCREAKLETIEANFLIGSHPDETLADINQTRRLIKELKPHKLLLSVVVPFPGTKVREQMLERNLIFSNDWRRYVLMDNSPPPWRTTNFNSEELKKMQNKILVEFYFNGVNILRNLKYMRTFSNFKAYFLSAVHIITEYLFFKLKPKIT
jgi:anaerobic magnesium-protoporphyrin IX monomethyl ester cyclase